MAACKDCVHVDVCCSYLSTAYNKCKLATPDFKLLKNIECDECQHFKDRSRFVELPCKVGDMVYCLTLPEKRRVTKITVTQYGLRITVNDMFSFDMSQIGKTVFLTEEEFKYALQLKQLKTGDKNT